MVLIEDEPRQPADVERAKAQVLAILQRTQPVRSFTTATELADFLDAVLIGMVQAGQVGGLTQVVLFHRQPAAAQVVRARLAVGARFLALDIPDAWGLLTRNLEDLRAWAARLKG